MVLDIDELTLKFKINDIDYGIAFEIEKNIKYKALFICIILIIVLNCYN